LPPIDAKLIKSPQQRNNREESELLDEDALYKSLMEGIHDKSMLEKSPQVLEYERRNRIKHEGYRRNAPERNVKLLSHTRTGGTDVAKSLSTLRQDLLSASTDPHSFNSIKVCYSFSFFFLIV
jgi:hypothetical protein